MGLHSDNSRHSVPPPDPHNLGWRLRVLRTRRSLTLVELAQRAGIDVSYLSRLERDALQNAKPKPDTINKVLDALDATTSEMEAIYHVERPPLTPDEIRTQIHALSSLENTPEPIALRDERWYVWYYNRSARAALDMSEAEYPKSIGVHMLHEVMDPSVPRYHCVPEHFRIEAFSVRAKMFRLTFAGEEFDGWYQSVVKEIYRFPWAADLWEHPVTTWDSLVIERQSMLLQTSILGEYEITLQINTLMANPRFVLVNWAPKSDEVRQKIEDLRSDPKYGYDALHVVAEPTIRSHTDD